jgi:hypothetical protein
MRLKSLGTLFSVIILSTSLTACISHPKALLPVHDEVLVYQLPYDLTYLRTLDSLMGVPGWDLEVTDKENGLIRVRNVDYTGLDNSDQRVAEFILKRVNRSQTSIELSKKSQQVLGAGDLIKAISAQLNREVAS